MKVLFVIENYLPHIGGVEIAFRNLAEGLVKKGHEATIVTQSQKGARARETVNGVRIIRVKSLHSRYVFSFSGMPAAIREARKADIIHTTTFNGALPAWIASKVAGKKCLITVHEVWTGKWHEYTDMNFLQARAHDLLEKLIHLIPFEKHVAVSESTRRHLEKAGKKPEHTHTIHNAVDYEHFNPKKHDSSTVRKEHGLQDSFVVLTYGRPGPSKGIEHAVRAVPLIKIPNLKYVFMLSKDRQYFGRLRKLKGLVSKLGVQDRVVLMEPVPYGKLPKYIRAADCVVVPSLAEGFGYTAAEASAMGVPVVASKTTSLPEVVSGKYLLVSPGSSREIADAVEKIYGKKHKTTPLKKFLPEKNVESHVKLYRRILKPEKKPNYPPKEKPAAAPAKNNLFKSLAFSRSHGKESQRAKRGKQASQEAQQVQMEPALLRGQAAQPQGKVGPAGRSVAGKGNSSRKSPV